MEEQKKTSSATTIVLSIILTAVLFGGGGFLYGQNIQTESSVETATPTATGDIAVTTPATNSSASTTYTNSKFGFSFDLPADHTVMEEYYYEGGPGVNIIIGKRSDDDVSGSIDIDLSYIENGSTYDEFLRTSKENLNEIDESSTITIDGNSAEKIKYSGLTEYYKIITARNNENMSINASFVNDEKINIIDQITNSFKFSK